MLVKQQNQTSISQYLPITNIQLNGGTQSRAELNQDVITGYAEAMREGVDFPPALVFYDGEHWWLVDGFHRIHAALKAGFQQIAADVRQGTRRDAVLYSVGVNADHGLQRTNVDKQRAIETLLRDEEWSQWSDSAIAKACKVNSKTVTRVRDDLGIPKSSIRRGTDGRVINTQNIGRNRVRVFKDDPVEADQNKTVATLKQMNPHTHPEEHESKNATDSTTAKNISTTAEEGSVNHVKQVAKQQTVELDLTPELQLPSGEPVEATETESSNNSSYNEGADKPPSSKSTATLTLLLPFEWLPLIEAAALREAKDSREAWIVHLIADNLFPSCSINRDDNLKHYYADRADSVSDAS